MIARTAELARLGVRNLLGYPLRTLLTTIGVVFGVGSVIAMIAVGAGAEHELLKEIGRLGIENIIINSVKPPEKKQDTQTNTWAFNRYGLTYKDESQIRRTLPGLREVLPVHKSLQTAWWGSRKVEISLNAVEARHLDLFRLRPERGRTLYAADGAALRRVCMIRGGLLTALGIYEDPLGLPLLVGETYYEIVGVLPDEGFLGYAQKALAVDSKRSEVYVPYGTFVERVGTASVTQREGSRDATDIQLSQLVVAVHDVDDVLETARMVQRVMEKNHEEKDYEVIVPLEVLAQRRKTQRIFNYALILMASISLVVGGIGIANIMLATVTERTKEIGIRRALGAKRRHIMAQFLTETTMISTLGGMIGVACGFGLIRIITELTGWQAIVTAGTIALAVSISVAVGILSGIFPARRAARLDPIAALRHE